jgi:hypothetical protein
MNWERCKDILDMPGGSEDTYERPQARNAGFWPGLESGTA